MKRRLLSVVLSLCVIMTLLPVTTFAIDSQADLLSGVWEGTYVGSVANNSHATIYRTLRFQLTYDGSNQVSGIASIKTDDTDCGQYYFSGTVNFSTWEIQFTGNKWIYNPQNLSFAEFEGEVDLSSGKMTGICSGNSSRTFTFEKISFDIDDFYAFRANDFIGNWEGEYDGQYNDRITVRRHYVMSIESCSDDGKISGKIAFSPIADEQYSASGSYYFSGNANFITGHLTYQGHTWIEYPKEYDNFTFAFFDGYLNSDKSSMDGNTHNTSSRTFNVVRLGSVSDTDPYVPVIDEEDSEMAYVRDLLQYSLTNADSVSKKSIQNAIYNLLFKAQFRPTESQISGDTMKFTGSLETNKTWPAQNNGASYAYSVTDGVLGKISFAEGGLGCMSYALFATAYTYGTSGTGVSCTDRSQTGIKDFIHKYADPGEQLRYRHSTNMHSIVFLGESQDGQGFYYISYDGGKNSNGTEYHDLYVGYWSYEAFAQKVTTSLTVRDTNGGSYSAGTAKSVATVRTGVGATEIVLRIACPVEAIVKLGNQVLDSRNPSSNSFGSVQRVGDQIIFSLNYDQDYELFIEGTDDGTMTVTLEYYTGKTKIDERTLIDVPVTPASEMTSSRFDPLASFVLYDDDVTWGVGINETVYKPDSDFSNENNGPETSTDISFSFSSTVKVLVDGRAVVWTDAEPFIDSNDRTMVPLRAVGEAMKLTVGWNSNTHEASFSGDGKTIYFPIDSSTAYTSDGGTVQMDTAAVIVNDRTYAPIRYLAEYFGFTVGWDGETQTVSITK